MAFDKSGSARIPRISSRLRPVIRSGRCLASVSSQVASMNWPAPYADDRGFRAVAFPPLSTETMRSAIMEKPDIVDLEPHQWKSEREKPKEPIFGKGWPIGIGVLVAIISGAILIDQDVMPRAVAGGL